MKNRIIRYKNYSNREQRCHFVASVFYRYLDDSVANIGGGGFNHLRSFIDSSVPYFEVDISGEPDLVANLETDLPLPIENNSWQTVVCTDVLEHLDNLHQVFDELVRISGKYLILSLPNPLESAFKSYVLNRPERKKSTPERDIYGRYLKFYGIPYKPPIDRHKWFFSYTDAEEFFRHKAKEHRLTIRELFGIGYHGKSFTNKLLRYFIKIFLGDTTRKNLFNRSIWVVFEKINGKI